MEEKENHRDETKKSHTSAIVVVIIVLAVGALIVYQLNKEGTIRLFQKPTGSQTLYWGGNYEIEVQVNWMKSKVTRKIQEMKEVKWFVSGTVRNKFDRAIKISSLLFTLQNKDGIILHQTSNALRSGAIEPNKSITFDHSEFIPVKLYSSFSELSGRMGHSFVDE